jgi:hypothetical protein
LVISDTGKSNDGNGVTFLGMPARFRESEEPSLALSDMAKPNF